MRSNRISDESQMKSDAKMVEYLEKLTYPVCQACGHDTWRHSYVNNTGIHRYAERIFECGFVDCVCDYPAPRIQRALLNKAMQDVFGDVK